MTCSILSFSQLRIQNFGISQGLPQSQVSAIAEDSQGYLWLGTLGGGVSRFDGSAFETFTSREGLINNFVRDLQIDANDHVWIATNKGISFYNGVKLYSLNITEQEGRYVTNIFFGEDETIYLLDNGETGKMWFDGTLHYKTKSVIPNVLSVKKSPSGSTYVLHEIKGVLKLIQFNHAGTLTFDVGQSFTRVHSVFLKDNQDLISTNEGLFSVADGRLSLFESLKNPVFSYNIDRQGFIGVNDSRISLIKGASGEVKRMDSVRYLVLTSLTDLDGTLWIGTDQGLFKIYAMEFENPLEGKDKFDAAQAICWYNNQLWIGTTYGGVKVYSNNKLIARHDFKSTGKNYITAIKTDRTGKLWISSMGGVAVYENGVFNWNFPDIIKTAMALDFDNNNNVLIGDGRSGIFFIKNGQVSEISGNATAVWCINYNKGNGFAIGTTTGVRIFKDGVLTSLDVNELKTKEVASLTWLDEQTLMIGTLGDGIFIYSFASNAIIKVISKGLLSNTIFLLFKDGDNIWVGSERGIDLLTYNQNRNEILSIQHFDDANGLSGLETNLNAVCRQGLLSFGLIKGLYEYRPASPLKDYKLHVKNINLFYEPVTREANPDPTDADTSSYTFNHTQNHLTFTFNKVSKRNPNKYYYSYRLAHFDPIWSTPSQSKIATYGNLSPGSYTFEVRATDRDGVFAFDSTSLKFTIRPAFYQTIAFKICAAIWLVLAAAGIVHWIYRAKARRIVAIQTLKDQEQTRLRKEIARDFHDELGNQVARMLNYVGILRISDKMEKETYSKLHGYSQAILTGTKDFVWALDPRNDDLESVLIHLRDFGERMFNEKGIDFTFNGKFEKIRLPLGYGRQINLIFKEAMTNAFNHSDAKLVEFRVRTDGDSKFTIQLNDDGTGMPPETILRSKRGIENMRLRALKIDSDLQITSNGNGVLVTLVISIPKSIA